MKVAKFGGSSLANSVQVQKVLDIIRADPERRYVVPSAPGKRHPDDDKVTDLLLHCHELASQGESIDEVFQYIRNRYQQIMDGLGLSIQMDDVFVDVYNRINRGAGRDYCASRGEYLSGIILSHALGFDFLDAADVIFFNARGAFDSDRTQEVLSAALKEHPYAVIPGFYGAYPDGRIKTFSRGGSDVTGAVVARAAAADEYENWTDVSGFMMADPHIVSHARCIDMLSYRELRELSYMGAQVLHEDSIFPVRQAGIPIHIRNTNRPDDPGTLIVNQVDKRREQVITGVAGRKDFTLIMIEKSMMNNELGFGRRVLSVLEGYGVSFEHMPSGIDSLSVVTQSNGVRGRISEILADIRESVDPDHIEVLEHISLIATVGQGMVRSPGTAARLFKGLADNHINVCMIDQGSSEMNIIVGVEDADFEKAVRAIYDSFVVEP